MALFGWAGVAQAAPPGAVKLYEAGGGRCYRIPAMAAKADGTVVALAEERLGRPPAGNGKPGKWEDCPDWGRVNIVARTSSDGGRHWSPPRPVVDHRTFETGSFKVALAGNPTVISLGGAKDFLLVFAVSRTAGIYNSTKCIAAAGEVAPLCGGVSAEHALWTSRSTDGGGTWSEPQPLQVAGLEGFVRPGPGNGIRLASGRIVVPAYAQLLLSDDDGKTWRSGAKLADVRGLAGSETTVIADHDGVIWASARPTQVSYKRLAKQAKGVGEPARLAGFSTDGGEHYQRLALDGRFPMSPIQASVATIGPDQTVAYGFPYSDEPPGGRTDNEERRRLTVCLLPAADRPAQAGRVIEEGSSSYSSLAALDNEHLGILYEAARDAASANQDTGYTQAIWFANLPLSWLRDGGRQPNCTSPGTLTPVKP